MLNPYTFTPTERQIILKQSQCHVSHAKNSEHMHQITGQAHYIETAHHEWTLARALQAAIEAQAPDLKQKVTEWAKQANAVRTTGSIKSLAALLADIIVTAEGLEREETK